MNSAMGASPDIALHLKKKGGEEESGTNNKK